MSEKIGILGKAFVKDDVWQISVKRCVACGKDHEACLLVKEDSRVWYRCPLQTRTLIYIREAKST